MIHLSVTELAQESGTSPATVVRFCQGLEFRGYQELKLALARETVAPDLQLLDEVDAADGPSQIVSKVLSGAANALQEAARAVDGPGLARLADLIVGANRVLFVAVGTSAPLASDAAYRLTTIGVDARFIADAHVQHVSARMLGPQDACVAVSHTGSTTETLTAVRAAARSGAATAAITSFARSPLTESVDRVLVAGSRETAYRIEAMTSRIVHMSVLDALFALVVLNKAGQPGFHGCHRRCARRTSNLNHPPKCRSPAQRQPSVADSGEPQPVRAARKQPEGASCMDGTVRNSGGSGVPNVTVSDGRTITRTAADGTFTIDPAGPFVFLTRPAGFTADPWFVPAGARDVTFTLHAQEDVFPYRFVHVSDLHVSVDNGKRFYPSGSELGSGEALARFLGGLPDRAQDVQSVIATGDLTDLGLDDEYRALQSAVAASTLPVHLLPGNHDHIAGTNLQMQVSRNGLPDPWSRHSRI